MIPVAASHPRPVRMRLAAFCLLCLSALPGEAGIQLAFGVEMIEGPDWRARDIGIVLDGHQADRFGLQIRVAELQLPDGQGTLAGVQLACDDLVRLPGVWSCAEGRLTVRDSPLGTQDAAWAGEYRDEGALRLEVDKLAVARGQAAVAFTVDQGGWSARVTPNRAHVAGLADLAGIELPKWGIKGRASGELVVSGRSADVAGLEADFVLDQLAYASPDGGQAAERVVLKGGVNARHAAGRWGFDARLRWPAGAVYTEPLFLDASDGGIKAAASGDWEPAAQRLRLDQWSIDLHDTVQLSGLGRFAGAALTLQDLTVAAHSQRADRLYERLLQPFLIGSVVDDLQVEGQIGLALHFDAEGIEQAGLELNRLAFEDRGGRFALGNTTGSVAWDRRREAPLSRLAVDAASVYRIPTGDFGVAVQFAGDRVDLVEPLVIPVLGGSVALDSFSLRGALMAGADPQWEASASLHDVSLEQLTAALEWPPFNGVVSGQLKDMRYADRLFRIGGGLQMDAFDGSIRVEGLTLRQPFGAVPILSADASLRGLSLEALTETFSFGRIEGRLDGDLQNLQLIAWQPDRFDLHLYTPPEDDSRHRISQRAVENLTELGSGVPAGISAGFLSIFEEFRYDRIDMKIRLEGSRAEIDGLARPDGGYYLVKGSGLPRIDVIGRNRSVAWHDLLERLRQIQIEGAQIR
jgi:hypothetical protein